MVAVAAMQTSDRFTISYWDAAVLEAARTLEPAGRRGDFAVAAPAGWTVGEPISLLEEPHERGPGAGLRPFEIRSWRLSRE